MKEFNFGIIFSAVGNEEEDNERVDRQRLVQMYEEKIEELIKTHDTELNEEKRCNNNRVDALLQRLAECNSRYCDLMPDYEQVGHSSSSFTHFLDTFTKIKFFWSSDH